MAEGLKCVVDAVVPGLFVAERISHALRRMSTLNPSSGSDRSRLPFLSVCWQDWMEVLAPFTRSSLYLLHRHITPRSHGIRFVCATVFFFFFISFFLGPILSVNGVVPFPHLCNNADRASLLQRRTFGSKRTNLKPSGRRCIYRMHYILQKLKCEPMDYVLQLIRSQLCFRRHRHVEMFTFPFCISVAAK